jgi:hypothetical protein
MHKIVMLQAEGSQQGWVHLWSFFIIL